ncbi:MAG: hypothetical protein ABJL52_00005, partial [Lentilitoribacter sp.]|uniref:hypothetical protein n=1 Tax=Parasphingorhabdus sp. TaxID=2709688 RepID=UPI0032972BE3
SILTFYVEWFYKPSTDDAAVALERLVLFCWFTRKGVAFSGNLPELVSGLLWRLLSGSTKCFWRFGSLTIEYEERETWAAEFCWMVWYFLLPDASDTRLRRTRFSRMLQIPG